MAPTGLRLQTAQITDVGQTTRAELREAGREERKRVPRSSHAGWAPRVERRDPLEILQESNASRAPELVPIRYGRMMQSQFTYFRGAPAVMAHDLVHTPTTAIHPQICGDAHLSNFGMFGTPERDLAFDLNDFDETLPGPFEWDLKRLVASFVVAARATGLGDKAGADAVLNGVEQYASALAKLADETTLGIWYTKVDADAIMQHAENAQMQKRLAKTFAKARTHNSLQAFEKLTTVVDGRRVIVDDPPIVMHLPTLNDEKRVQEFWNRYVESLPADRAHLVSQYHLVDVALKVVGVGSVGTRCFITLLAGRADLDPLFLQVKEAQASVLEAQVGGSGFEHHGERVVVGQRLLQAASDVFLGWATGPEGVHFFVRQLRDMKYSADIATLTRTAFVKYAGVCGLTLARAHASTLDPALISGYVGKGQTLGAALLEFARDYANQTEADHAQLVEAVRDGQIEAVEDK